MTLNFSQAQLQNLITHHVGNKSQDERVKLSTELTQISEETRDHLLHYFFLHFKPEEFQQFDHTVELGMNEVFTTVKDMFNEKVDFVEGSQNLAQLLYEYSVHPNIKAGKLNVAHFSEIVLDGELVEVIGIFKSETDAPFLKMEVSPTRFLIHHDSGFEIKGIDKACLIFKTDEDSGYRVLAIDKTNRSSDAHYWKDEYLKLTARSDDYHHTKDFLNITKDYVTGKLNEDFEVSKTEKIDLLNRSVEYFKTNEKFDKEDFEEQVFQSPEVIDSFQNFDKGYRAENSLDPVEESFDISRQAVKKQARIFKSVLKLDKNFHVYIHGDKELIEQGTESDGRKFYKIYYDKEE